MCVNFKLKKRILSVLLCVGLCAGLCLGMTACGNSGETAADTSSQAVSSGTEDAAPSELEKLIQEDQFQEQVKALSQTYEDKGMKLEVVAEGDAVVYRCIYTVAIDNAKSKEELSEHLESKAFETSIDSVLRSFRIQVPQTRSVIVRYIDMNGNIIASKEYK